MSLSALAGLVLAITLSAAAVATATAAPAGDQARWVLVDDVRVRAGAGPGHAVVGTLLRGAELTLTHPQAPSDTFCMVQGEGKAGFVACQYLSRTPVARAKAGEGGIGADQRWVGGNGLTLRAAPDPAAPSLGSMALNTIVKLLRQDAGGGYCEVRPATGPDGFIACRYLVQTPVILAHIRGDDERFGSLSVDYDPERAFWLQPSWAALRRYVEHVHHSEAPHRGPWPRDEALERMKAHLALGLQGRAPRPYASWAGLKRKAAQYGERQAAIHQWQAQAKRSADEVRIRGYTLDELAAPLQEALLLDVESRGTGGVPPAVGLVQALEFPAVSPSLFRSDAELAPPGATTEEVSGRFGIVFRQLVSARPVPKAGAADEGSAGLYDMLARTQLLVKPVQRVRLMRDGSLRLDSTLLRASDTLYDASHDDMGCRDWQAGFRFGAADPAILRFFGTQAPLIVNNNPAGSLFAFYLKHPPARVQAVRTEVPVKLDRERTGFVGGVHLNYDLDGDGILDLAVFEGKGKGPGHLEGPTTTDDAWYRLALVNIDGTWKLLASDSYSYGCGC